LPVSFVLPEYPVNFFASKKILQFKQDRIPYKKCRLLPTKNQEGNLRAFSMRLVEVQEGNLRNSGGCYHCTTTAKKTTPRRAVNGN